MIRGDTERQPGADVAKRLAAIPKQQIEQDEKHDEGGDKNECDLCSEDAKNCDFADDASQATNVQNHEIPVARGLRLLYCRNIFVWGQTNRACC